MTTLAPPETSSAEDVLEDFEVPCDVRVVKRLSGTVFPVKRCEKPAKFFGHMPCCGMQALVCKEHAEDDQPWYCPLCKQNHSTEAMGWQPL